MFLPDILFVIGVMSLLFLRYINIYKERTKINYTPIVLAVGMIGGLLHFILFAEEPVWLLILKESLIPLSVGIVLSAIMTAMYQAQKGINSQENQFRLETVVEGIEAQAHMLREYDKHLAAIARMEDSTHDQLRIIFKEEVDALHVIQSNQKHFISKIEALLAQQQLSMEKFEEFTLTELPGLDNIVHRHIDLLRVAEQDHFNQLKLVTKSTCEGNKEVYVQLKAMEESIRLLRQNQAPDRTVALLQKELNAIITEFARHIQALGSKSEGIMTTLLENDALLRGSREQSELIMQQMVLSSKQMREMSFHSKELYTTFKPLGTMFASAEELYRDFLGARGKLGELIVTLESYEKQEHRVMRDNLERLASEVGQQLSLLSQALPKREKSEPFDPRNIHELSGKVKLHRSYMEDLNEH
ncbi:MAG: hypothetical protein M0P91_07110 [Sulfuricurvum sp.]|jgi:hypothetical protein|uniref:hypothetical protein n=1 Tax=Sulfuricurvum sp. TaxID=2025608 RepID=UPI0025E5B57F|nr:hypothetical protein [Sulfuricurvum sp.]MCK9372949.1 hypothetical protein [Sulfuricurvum sp.]